MLLSAGDVNRQPRVVGRCPEGDQHEAVGRGTVADRAVLKTAGHAHTIAICFFFPFFTSGEVYVRNNGVEPNKYIHRFRPVHSARETISRNIAVHLT